MLIAYLNVWIRKQREEGIKPTYHRRKEVWNNFHTSNYQMTENFDYVEKRNNIFHSILIHLILLYTS